MGALSAERKQKLLDKMMKIQENFTEKGLFALIAEFKSIMIKVLFSEIEEWLLSLARQGNIPLVDGLLAALYCSINNFEDARQYADLARKSFPDTEFWDGIIIISNKSIERQEKEPQSKDPFGDDDF